MWYLARWVMGIDKEQTNHNKSDSRLKNEQLFIYNLEG